ncbi:MAG: MFS transporter [Treponema sp.]
MKNTTNTRPLTLKAYLAYGAGDLYGGGTFFLVTTFCMYYLVNVVGMHPFTAGLVPAVGKLWDAVSDPLMGYIADNTPDNRFGKRRVWFLISVVPIAVSFILIWFPVTIPTEFGRFLFFLFAYLFFFTVQTVSYIPYAALSAEMTRDFAERNKLNSSRIMFSFIATLAAGLVAQPIIDAYDGSKQGYFVMGCVFGLFFAIPWIPLYFGTWELPSLPQPKQKISSFLRNFLSLFRNKSCRIHIAMYVCSYGALDIFMSLVLFYFVDYLEKGMYFVIAQGSLLISMMIMLPFYNKVATKKGHGYAYMLGLIVFTTGIILMAFQTPETSNVLLILNIILMGAGIAGGNLVPHQLLPFITDIDRLITGQNRAGTYSAAMTLARKIFLGGIVMTVLGAILSGIGYKNPVPSVLTQPQFEEAVHLCKVNNENPEILYAYYSKLPDENWHLRYMTQNIDSIITAIHKQHKKAEKSPEYHSFFEKGASFTVIPHDIFETYLLHEGKANDYKHAEQMFLLQSSYIKSAGGYVRSAPSDFVTKEDLYELKILFDRISFAHPGIGIVQKPQQKASTLKGVRFFFILLPLIMLIAGIVYALNFKVTPETHAVILAEIDRLDAGGKKEDVTPENKRICELLTGIPYEKMRINS